MSVLKNAKRRQSFKLEGEGVAKDVSTIQTTESCGQMLSVLRAWKGWPLMRFCHIRLRDRLWNSRICEDYLLKIQLTCFEIWLGGERCHEERDVNIMLCFLGKRCEMRDRLSRLSSLKWPLCFLLQCHIVLPWFLCQGGHEGEASCYLLVWHLMKWWFPLGSWPKRLSYLKFICQ